MNYIKLFFSIFLISFIASCDIINPEEDIPGYIEILPFDYTPESGGSNSTKITDGWIYVNGEFLGAFNLPNTIPVLNSGEVDILIDPGIKENGIVETPNIYPFYTRYTETVNLVPGEEISIQPSTTYDDDDFAKFLLVEDFNDATINFTADVVLTQEDTKEGNSGLIILDVEDKPTVAILSDPIIEFSGQGDLAFLELDYKSEESINVFVGVVGYNNLGLEEYREVPFGAVGKAEWNKMYFNFTNLMGALKERGLTSYQVLIGTELPIENGEFAIEQSEVRIDNVKLIVF